MKKRIGLVIFGIIGLIESLVNLVLYLTFLDLLFGAVDWQMPFWFKYCEKFLRSDYIKSLKDEHGENIQEG